MQITGVFFFLIFFLYFPVSCTCSFGDQGANGSGGVEAGGHVGGGERRRREPSPLAGPTSEIKASEVTRGGHRETHPRQSALLSCASSRSITFL